MTSTTTTKKVQHDKMSFSNKEIKKAVTKITSVCDTVSCNNSDLAPLGQYLTAIVEKVYRLYKDGVDFSKLELLLIAIDEFENIEHTDFTNSEPLTIFDLIRNTDLKWSDIASLSTMIRANYSKIETSDLDISRFTE